MFWTSRVRPVVRSLKRCNAYYSTGVAGQKRHDPLRILFCGADEFSIYSLRALEAFQKKQPNKIESIDVVCRPDKRVGRGLKKIQEVPIKSVATGLGLNLHQIDTFTGWSPPKCTNLIVAVSFGLLVPSRILRGAQYGGLNVHPSMLPDFRGPAPIQHALLNRRTHTGVTVQTMHPTKFDHGKLVAQTPEPGIEISKGSTVQQLIESLGPLGADMLCRSIDEGVFIEPVHDLGASKSNKGVTHAPKITPEDRHIDWSSWTAEDVQLRDQVLGRLWDRTTHTKCAGSSDQGQPKRITFQGPWFVMPEQIYTTPGTPRLAHPEHKENKLAIQTADGQSVIPTEATIEGEKKNTGLDSLATHLRKATSDSSE